VTSEVAADTNVSVKKAWLVCRRGAQKLEVGYLSGDGHRFNQALVRKNILVKSEDGRLLVNWMHQPPLLELNKPYVHEG
jgi:hypothetical protein